MDLVGLSIDYRMRLDEGDLEVHRHLLLKDDQICPGSARRRDNDPVYTEPCRSPSYPLACQVIGRSRSLSVTPMDSRRPICTEVEPAQGVVGRGEFGVPL